MSRINVDRQRTLCLVLKGYPRLSETFIAQEIRELERSGFIINIVSLRHPYDPATHPIHDEIVADVLYLPEYLHQEPMRVISALAHCVFRGFSRASSGANSHSSSRGKSGGKSGGKSRDKSHGNFWQAALQFAKDFRRDRTRNRLRRFGQACVMAREAPVQASFYYSHFMHTPASVTHYASLITGIRWGISAHAKDIWTIPEWEKRQKLQSIDWLVTCTKSNFEHLRALSTTVDSAATYKPTISAHPADHTNTPDEQGATVAAKVHLVYHGIDLSRFSSPQPKPNIADGSDKQTPVNLLSVGRTVSKKGYEYLLQALSQLPTDLHWTFVHIGGGELTEQLQTLAKTLSIDSSITWCGAQPQSVVLDALNKADLFVLPSVIGDDGDRDGLPNVLMEAQSQKLACLSTNISGIPELIEHGVTGWLVDERNTDQLTAALTKLIKNPELRKSLASKGYDRLHAEFSHTTCLHTLHGLLEQSLQNSLSQAS